MARIEFYIGDAEKHIAVLDDGAVRLATWAGLGGGTLVVIENPNFRISYQSNL